MDSDRILVMDDGRVAGPPDSFLALLVQKLLDLLVHTAFLC